MTVSVRQLATWVGLFGLLTVGLLLIGVGMVGQVFALVQLVGLIGLPLALLLYEDLRSRSLVLAIGWALSLAITALAFQSLSWFGFARPELTVLLATVYGFVLAWLLSSTVVSRGRVLQTLERSAPR